ncbi:hypothetical protein BDY19DRAFT_1060215 [Irpex rosettiformis]|uniref:Uncharacterized protein n=1 Tax=Irpex rosettiformis TaxID=378272 RepID=A0ACB8TR45_9APHY|nr:hypothetical protein BDY19DRAFT_1060215 [Irpex rosettiformis]
MDDLMDIDPLVPPSCSIKKAVSAPAIRGHVEQGRNAVAEDIGSSIHEAPVQWFKDNILPPLPSGLCLSSILRALEEDKHITTEGRWKVFPKNHAKSPKGEDAVYGPFASVAAAIGAAAANKLPYQPQRVVFKCNPHLVPISRLRENRSRPDGYGVYTSHDNYQPQTDGSGIHWEFIVAPGEKKKKESDSDFNDNVRKILWSFSHIMRDDHRRRFVIGYTIENKHMRLWFCSRKDIIVTKSFNFIRDHATLAHFFLSQMYAKAHELGYDPTIRPPPDIQLRVKNQWNITVHYTDDGEGQVIAGSNGKRSCSRTREREITFRTIDLLSSIGAEAVRSRGTRVWAGQLLINGQIQPDSDNMVMKEYWVDSDRVREAEIWRRILEDAPTEKDREILKRHLLTPLYSGDVVVDGKLDTTDYLRRYAAISEVGGLEMVPLLRKPKETNYDHTVMEADDFAPQGSGAIPSGPVTASRIVVLHDKSHHRIIFKEKGTTIEHLTTVSRVLRAGIQALNGLAVMHKSGWVHRDISSGNILVVDGVVKISDLEYAKKMSDSTSHSERSGTALFMSVEAQFHAYKFLGGGKAEEDGTAQDIMSQYEQYCELLVSDDDALLDDNAQSWVTSSSTSSDNSPIFRYNPLHDIESVWWLLVYLLLYRPPSIKSDTSSRVSSQSSFYRPFFSTGDTRRAAFAEEGVFTKHEKELHPALRPISKTLNEIRVLLFDRYVEVEQGDISKIDHTVAADLVPQMVVKLGNLVARYTEKDVKLSAIRLSRGRPDPEPLIAAAAAGASLDSRQLTEAKKRALNDDAEPKESSDDARAEIEETRMKRARKDVSAMKATSEGSSTMTAEKEKSRSGLRKRTESSGASSGNVPLRRSLRNLRKVQPAKS